MTASPADTLKIGECRVFPGTGEIERDNRRIKLEPKVMSLLLYLAEQADRAVTREQLFDALWPGLVVTDDTLTQAIIKLRKALDDNARHPRYIETLPKRGYRLLAAVSRSKGGFGNAPAKGTTGRRGYLVAGLILVLVAALGAIPLLEWERLTLPVAAVPVDTRVENLPTLTVEPFQLLGADRSQAYLAQGITHDLVTDLSRLSGLWVIGSRSILGQSAEASATGQVGYRVVGEVQRAQQQLRINVHLVDVARARQLWSERYQVPFDQLFQVQGQMTRQIASTLSLKVNQEERKRLAYRYTRNVQAYEYFLQAQSLLLVRQKAENEQARRRYRQAIELDPSFARAYAGLALSIAAEYRNQWTDDGHEALEQARSMAKTALQIDPEIPEVYWVLAYVNTQQRKHDRAIGLLEKAISLDRSFADAYALLGGVSTYMGDTARSPELLRKAIRLNPDAGYLYYLLLGRAYFYLGEWELAQINLQEALARNPANLEAHIYLSAVLESSGAHEDASWQTEEITALQPGFSAENWLRTYPMTDPAQRERLLVALARLGLSGESGVGPENGILEPVAAVRGPAVTD